MARQVLDFVVLDALADDVEDIEHIFHRANHATVGWRELNEGRDFRRSDVVRALIRLIRDDLVEACTYSKHDGGLIPIGSNVQPPANLDEYWFTITARGRTAHASWNPTGADRE